MMTFSPHLAPKHLSLAKLVPKFQSAAFGQIWYVEVFKNASSKFDHFFLKFYLKISFLGKLGVLCYMKRGTKSIQVC